MKRWAGGHELLETLYAGNKGDFFKAIGHGELVPFSSQSIARCKEETDGAQRIISPHCKPLQEKLARLNVLKERLERNDEEHLKNILSGKLGNFDQEEFERFKVEEGPALLEKLSRNRPKWKEEFDRLHEEIGDQEKALSPSLVWRGVTLTGKVLPDQVYVNNKKDVNGKKGWESKEHIHPKKRGGL